MGKYLATLCAAAALGGLTIASEVGAKTVKVSGQIFVTATPPPSGSKTVGFSGKLVTRRACRGKRIVNVVLAQSSANTVGSTVRTAADGSFSGTTTAKNSSPARLSVTTAETRRKKNGKKFLCRSVATGIDVDLKP